MNLKGDTTWSRLYQENSPGLNFIAALNASIRRNRPNRDARYRNKSARSSWCEGYRWIENPPRDLPSLSMSLSVPLLSMMVDSASTQRASRHFPYGTHVNVANTLGLSLCSDEASMGGLILAREDPNRTQVYFVPSQTENNMAEVKTEQKPASVMTCIRLASSRWA
jgi:hypothetical protein